MSRVLSDHLIRPGHKCRSAYPAIKAGDLRSGKIGGLKGTGWILSFNPRQQAYIVHRDIEAYGRFDYWLYSNFNCATVKLAELTRVESARTLDDWMAA